MNSPPALRVADVRYRYKENEAVRGVSFEVSPGQVFALLGPNGSGKTTLFRLISTLIPLQQGTIEILGHNVGHQVAQVRSLMGVVFQAPSVDKKLTVLENLWYRGRLYGLSGSELRQRSGEMLERLGLTDKSKAIVETLSGGQRRRVELAQSMLHNPRMLVLDEPSTGLDPGARIDLWHYFASLIADGVTIVLTTHLLEEAARADYLGIMHQGQLAALDTPAALQASIGGDSILIRTAEPDALASEITQRFQVTPTIIDNTLRLEQPDGASWVPRLMDQLGGGIESITLGKPTLEDVFVARTGHRFFEDT
jgi:ABC-2 type transport system ATP-binding protein